MATTVLQVNPQSPEQEKIIQAAQVIRSGGLVIFPTETVYGIAVDYNNPKAVARLREVKGRAQAKPFATLISQPSIVANYTSSIDTGLYKLVDQYWPGPLTVIVPSKIEGQTIGVRMPNNLIAQQMIAASQCTVAAPSANLEGCPPPSTCEEALKDLDGLVDLALDGGPAYLGESSSIVDFTKDYPTIVREGAIKQSDVDNIVGTKNVLFVCTGNSCRSVMAEYLLKDRLQGRVDVNVASAGVGVVFASGASQQTLSVLREKDINASAHRSQQLTPMLLKKSDLIFTMTQQHRQFALELAPSAEKRIYLLREFINSMPMVPGMMDVPDPMGSGHAEYQHCLNTISEAIEKIVELI